MIAFLANLLLALAWLMLTGRFTPGNFVLGFGLAFFLLYFGQPVIGRSRYFRKTWTACSFALFVTWELTKANVRVAAEILTLEHRMHPGVVAVPLEARTNAEIMLLANLITLTPGSLTLDVSADRRVLYVHTLYVHSAEQFRAQVKQGLERRVLELLR